MDALIYTVMSGADRTLYAQQVHANNLANVGTSGFRADLEVAASQAVPGHGFDARYLSTLQANAVNASAGTITDTGRSLDAAIQGTGYFTVGYGGGEAYTRSGAFTIDDQGALSVNGRPVMGDGGPIVLPPYDKVQIGSDGTISIQAQGATQMQPVDKLKLVNPAANEVTKNEAGLIVSRSGTPLAADDNVKVQGGHLEGSNVSAVAEMVATMSLNRDFEIQMRLYKAADDMTTAGNNLIRS
jgi:flagellar basal-body rod protein FlgF